MVTYTMENSVALFPLAGIQINTEKKLQEFLLFSAKKRGETSMHFFMKFH